MADLSLQGLGEAVAALTGELDQVPPMYSAKKQQGRRLHELARAGLEVERAPVRVRVGGWRLDRLEEGRLSFEVRVSAGTYVRVLAEDLGRLVGCPAHLDSLRRLASGALRVEQALRLGPGRDEGPSPEEARAALIPMACVPLSLGEARVVSAEALGRLLHGRSLAAGEWEGTSSEGLELSLRDSAGDLVGIGLVGPGGELCPVAILRDPA